MFNWEEIYLMLVGELEETSTAGTEAYGCSEAYEAAYDAITDARNCLCNRFGIEPEDRDLEKILNSVVRIEKDIAKRAFLYGISYAGKENISV